MGEHLVVGRGRNEVFGRGACKGCGLSASDLFATFDECLYRGRTLWKFEQCTAMPQVGA